MATTPAASGDPAAPRPRLLPLAGLAATVAAALNAALYLVGVATGIFSQFGWFPEGRGDEMMLGPILLVSVVGAAAGVGVYGLCRRFASRPLPIFTAIAAVVLILSMVPPFAMGWRTAQVLLLLLMHVVTAGVVLWAVRR
jgi:hypothetical protein